MYVIGLSDSYHWPVKVAHPKDGGGAEVREFDAKFRRLTQDEIDDINRRTRDGLVDDRAFCKEVLIGWRGMMASPTEELPFSQTNLERVLNIEGMPSAIVRAFYASIREGKEKN